MITRLTHIKYNEIQLFATALQEYWLHLSNIEDNENQLIKSISHTLWYELDRKNNREQQPTNNTIKLPFHNAYTLVKALIYYQQQLHTSDYNHAVIERLKNALLQQLPMLIKNQ